VGILEGRRPLGRPRHRWEDNIKNVSSRSKHSLCYKNISEIKIYLKN
jgi:hypothetical protein